MLGYSYEQIDRKRGPFKKKLQSALEEKYQIFSKFFSLTCMI